MEYSTSNLQRLIFNNIGQSIFKADRITFGLHLVKGIRPEIFELNEWDFFLGNAVGMGEAKMRLPSWALEDRTEAFDQFASIF